MTSFRKFLSSMVFVIPGSALAADPPGPSPAPSEGFYAGAHVGYMFGNANATVIDGAPIPGGQSSAGGTNNISTLIGGFQLGYEHVFPSHMMLGLEFDTDFTDYMDGSTILSYRYTPVVTAQEQNEILSTLRGRIGYAVGSWTPYLTGGLAIGMFRPDLNDNSVGLDYAAPGTLRFGYVAGVGVDKALDKRWSARLEYLYTHFGSSTFSFAPQASYSSEYDLQRIHLGINYHLGVDGEDPHIAGSPEDDRGPGSWEVHGQSTFIFQGYTPFPSAIPDGPQSLPQVGESRNTYTGSLFFGVRLWQGGELYYNPELLQGFGLANTTGLAGFSNGEAQKSNFPFLQYSTSRLFLRQTWGMGGETEKIDSDYGQLAGVYDVSRFTVQVGRYAVHDLFDTNDYAQDGRVDFFNWSIWAAGAFDYAADKVGLTYGITAELNEKDWAVRAGYFLVGDHPNSNVYSMNLFSTGMYVGEGEYRYKIDDHPGVFKAGVWTHITYAANFNAVSNLIFATGLDAEDATLMERRVQAMVGYYLNLQQEITDDVGLFARWSWNDGQSEYSAFTDIGQSVSGGLSIKGKRWGRPDDTFGIGVAVNQITANMQTFLANGGTGILIGDGSLSYMPEQIIEAYYSYQVTKGFVATADYQWIANPAYDAIRGPVNVFSGRLRVNF